MKYRADNLGLEIIEKRNNLYKELENGQKLKD